MGSCFSENIGGWLRDLKFDAHSNICGITYNPVSIALHITGALSGDQVSEIDLLKSREVYVHPDFHSIFNHEDESIAKNQINNSLTKLGNELRTASYLFLTFGTSIVFEFNATKEIVNNCHHLPASDFSKRMLHEDEMLVAIKNALDLFLNVNPKLKIVLTISPIRHLRHGAIENNRSKARLIRLCEMLESEYEFCTYLPVYEFVMDELRDYRFYRQDDLIHLNDLGIGLIQEKFVDVLIAKEALAIMDRVKKLQAMEGHKIMHPNSEEAAQFFKKLAHEKQELEKILPGRF